MAWNELQWVEWLRNEQRRHACVALGIGDDMAALTTPGAMMLVSTDMLLDGIHFDTKQDGLAQIGRKAVACALSDCAAMAVRPMALCISVAFPNSFAFEDAQQLFGGMFAIATEFDAAIVGGDTTRWSNALALDVAVTAVPYASIDPVTRAGARRGDGLYVTGPLGGSRRGAHLTFIPRVREARAMAECFGVRLHAMIDISDGLSLDLWRMCQASRVGATLDETLLDGVISEEAKRSASQSGRTPLEHALEDGEDFELLLAVEGSVESCDVPLHRIGDVTAKDILLQDKNGRTEPLETKGYVH